MLPDDQAIMLMEKVDFTFLAELGKAKASHRYIRKLFHRNNENLQMVKTAGV